MQAGLHTESPEVRISPTFIDINRSNPQLLISELRLAVLSSLSTTPITKFQSQTS